MQVNYQSFTIQSLIQLWSFSGHCANNLEIIKLKVYESIFLKIWCIISCIKILKSSEGSAEQEWPSLVTSFRAAIRGLTDLQWCPKMSNRRTGKWIHDLRLCSIINLRKRHHSVIRLEMLWNTNVMNLTL